MYSVVLMVALTTSVDLPDRGCCRSGCFGGRRHSCIGCYCGTVYYYQTNIRSTATSFENTIKPYFTECYRKHMLFKFDLWSADDVMTYWQDIYDAVQNKSMPKAGCPEGVWNDDQRNRFLADFQAWKDGGYQP